MGLRWRDLPYVVVVVLFGSALGGILGWLTYTEEDEPLS